MKRTDTAKLKSGRIHWINIFENLYRAIPVLIFPLLRGFLSALRGDLYAWLNGTWVDILIVLGMITYSVLRWYFTRFSYGDRMFRLDVGLFYRSSISIPIERVCSVSVEHPWMYFPFRASRLRIDTMAGSRRTSDIRLTVPTAVGMDVFDRFEQLMNHGSNFRYIHTPKLFYIMIVSAFFSNSFASVALIATFFSQIGQLLGEDIGNQVVGTLANIAKLLSFGLPPAAAFIAYTVIGIWVLAFLLNSLRYQKFSVERHQNTLLVSGGVPTRRTYSLKVHEINFLTIRQSVFTRLLGLSSVFVHCVGFGKHKSDITAVTPAGTAKEIRGNLKKILPELTVSPITVRPNLGAIFKFIIDPLWPCVLLPFATWLLIRLFPSWAESLFFAGFMASIPFYWWMIVRILDFVTAGIGACEESVTLRYSKGFYLCTTVIPWDKIAAACIRQSILQRTDNKCDVLIFSRTEGAWRHHIKNVDINAARQILRFVPVQNLNDRKENE